jgi:hypothetical protein
LAAATKKMTSISGFTGLPDKGAILDKRLMSIGLEDAMCMVGFEDCVAGVLERFGMSRIVLYDKEKVIQKLMDKQGCNYEEALEDYEYNQLGSWLGDHTPGFLVELPE